MWLEAEDLISGSRLDVFARTGFVRDRKNGELGSWSRNLYRDFLLVSGVDGRNLENGARSSMRDYFHNFEQLIDSLQSDGFNSKVSSIPLTDQGITNGAHRLAIALELGLKVHVTRSDEEFSAYDYRWMRRHGLASLFIDAMAFELISRSPRARATVVFGLETRRVDTIEKVLSTSAEIAIRKRVGLSEVGKRRLVELCYDHNTWWTDGLLEKMTAERFSDGESHCDVIFTLEKDLQTIRERKAQLRQTLLSGHFNRKIHGSDHYFDTFFLAEGLLNENSISFLNSAPIGSERRTLDALGGAYRSRTPSETGREWCIDGSSTLEIHGLRLANDIDFIATSTLPPPVNLLQIAHSHRETYKYGLEDYTEIIRDPRKHLIFKGIKFISLSALMQIKMHQQDLKSVSDRQLIVNWSQSPLKLYQTTEMRVSGRLAQLTFWIASKLNRVLFRLPDRVEHQIRRLISRVRKTLI